MSFFCLGFSIHNSPLSLSSAPLADLCGSLEFPARGFRPFSAGNCPPGSFPGAPNPASSHTVGTRLPPPVALDRFFRRGSGTKDRISVFFDPSAKPLFAVHAGYLSTFHRRSPPSPILTRRNMDFSRLFQFFSAWPFGAASIVIHDLQPLSHIGFYFSPFVWAQIACRLSRAKAQRASGRQAAGASGKACRTQVSFSKKCPAIRH